MLVIIIIWINAFIHLCYSGKKLKKNNMNQLNKKKNSKNEQCLMIK